jgi:hypothetical protein
MRLPSVFESERFYRRAAGSLCKAVPKVPEAFKAPFGTFVTP